MERRLNFVPSWSLEEMALRRVVVNLWSEDDVLASIEDLRYQLLIPEDEDGSFLNGIYVNKLRESDQWSEIIETVKDKVSKCVLPESLKHRMTHIVWPIGWEVLRWRLQFQEAQLSDSREESRLHLQQLCWTSAGTVDYAKTAERLLRLRTIDVVKRYKLACLYCLEEGIKSLWKELPEEYKTGINGELGGSPFKATPLEDYWTQILKGENPNVNFDTSSVGEFSLHCRAFEYSTRKGNKAAAEYFLQKLTDEERGSSLVKTAYDILHAAYFHGLLTRRDFPKEGLFDVFCYLLSQMTPEDKLKMVKNLPRLGPLAIFRCFVHWPFQGFVLHAVDIVCALPKSNYGCVARSISEQVGARKICFSKLLQDFFFRCPRDLRKHFVLVLFESFVEGCPCIPNIETIKEIFRSVDLREEKLSSSIPFVVILQKLVIMDEWDVVEVCIKEIFFSQKDGENLRVIYSMAIICRMHKLTENGRKQRFNELLDKIEASVISKDSKLNF